MKNIVVPTDCSDLSGYALTLAEKLARQTGAKIYILKVVPTSADAVFDREGELLESEDFDVDAIKAEVEISRKQILDWVESTGIQATPVVKAGTLTDQILNFIKTEKIDLVVMGTHGLKGIRELIADSVTGHLVRQSTVPVLSLKCNRSDLEIKNIIFASSFISKVPANVGFLKNLQQAFGAKIHLLRVNTPSNFKTTRFLKEQMDGFVRQNELENTEFHIYCDNDVESGILHFTEDKNIDMISIGVEPDSLSKLFQKHLSSALVHHVYHPVLTFKI